METFVDKSELIDRLKRAKIQVDAILLGLNQAQTIQPDNVNGWSINDLLAHFIAHEQRALEELRMAVLGEKPDISINDNDAFNLGAVFASRSLSFEQIYAAWNRSFWQIIQAVEDLDEANFDPSSKVVLLLDDTIDGALANNTYEHYAAHLLLIS